jgi:hypothetical protein
MAEPTEASAAICFADLMLGLEMSIPRSLCLFGDYTMMLELSSSLARRRAPVARPADKRTSAK